MLSDDEKLNYHTLIYARYRRKISTVKNCFNPRPSNTKIAKLKLIFLLSMMDVSMYLMLF